MWKIGLVVLVGYGSDVYRRAREGMCSLLRDASVWFLCSWDGDAREIDPAASGCIRVVCYCLLNWICFILRVIKQDWLCSRGEQWDFQIRGFVVLLCVQCDPKLPTFSPISLCTYFQSCTSPLSKAMSVYVCMCVLCVFMFTLMQQQLWRVFASACLPACVPFL